MSDTGETFSPSEQFAFALELLGEGRTREAIAVLTAQLGTLEGMSPTAEAECHYWLGIAHTEIPDFETAARAFVRGTALLAALPPSPLAGECAAAAAESLDELGRPADAIPHLRSAARAFVARGNFDDAAHCEEGLGSISASLDDHEAAESSFVDAARLFERSSASDAARCWHSAAESALELDDARRVAQHARRSLQLGGPSDVEARGACAYLLGLASAEMNDAAAAANAARDAVRDFRAAGTLGDSARASDLLGSALADLDELPEAHGAFRQAHEWFLLADEFSEAGQSLRNAADVTYRRGDRDDSLTEVVEARRLFELGGDDVRALYSTQSLGILYIELGRREAAWNELTQARRQYEERDMLADAAECADKLGDLLAESGRSADAVAMLDTAAAGYSAHGRHLEAAESHRRSAMVHMTVRAIADADASLVRSTAELERAGEIELAAEMEHVRGTMFGEVGRYDDELEAYRRARRLFESARSVAGIAWTDANTAGVLMVRGDSATAERLLLGAIPALDGERAADAQRMLIMVYFETSNVDAAERLLPEVRRAATTPEREADWLFLDGTLRYLRSRYRDAANVLGTAVSGFRALGSSAKVAQCQQTIAMCDYFLGRHAAAESALLESRGLYAAEQRAREVAAVDLALGAVYIATGRFRDALIAYERARTAAEALGLANEALKATINIGALYIKWSRPADALAALRGALPMIGTAGRTFQTASFQNALGAAEIIAGRTSAGIPLVSSALEFFAADPAFRWHVAACHVNLALAATLDRRHDAALTGFGNARTVFTELGLGTELAKCDFLAAVVLVDRSSGGTPSTPTADLMHAFDLAIPATVYIDGRRLQFASAPTRVAWGTINLEFRSLLLRWAAQSGDAALVADLVESAINSGIHTTKLADLGTLVEAFGDASDGPGPTPDVDASGSTLSAGAGALIAGAVLPMEPPPLLRMPDGHIALGSFIDSAFHRYGGSRPVHEVSVV